MEHIVSLEENDTHRSLVQKGSNHYRHAKITVPVEQKTASVEINDDKKEEVWKSCCFTLSPHGVVYCGQFFISLIIIGVCFYMLILAEGDCNRSAGYLSLLSFLLGKLLSTVATSA